MWEVLVIENTLILYISINIEFTNSLVVEEIFDAGHYDFGIKKYTRTIPLCSYWGFNGILGYSNPYHISKYELINTAFPNLQINDLYNKWEGIPYSYALFDLKEEPYHGIAICHTNAKQTLKKYMTLVQISCLPALHVLTQNTSIPGQD